MSLSIDVYLDRAKMISLARWRAVISEMKLPLIFAEDFDPTASIGCIRCRYEENETTIEYYFNEIAEASSVPQNLSSENAIAEFRVNTSYGEDAWNAAISASAALCIAVGGTIEDADCRRVSAKKAASWARGILRRDDALIEAALAFPHPEDDVQENAQSAGRNPWWKFWL
jgi:hypothetical protein